MASFNISWRTSTKKDLRKLPPHEIPRILAEVEQLAEQPFSHGSEKLVGSQHTYRIRIGDYRVIYNVSLATRTIQIERIRHRKDVYR